MRPALASDAKAASPPPFENMRWIPAGEFRMGSEDFYPEERPVHRVAVDGFWTDERPVAAAEFRRFVRETGYVTFCERPLDPALYPDADPELLVPGSLVFRKTAGPVDIRDFRNWWEYVPGAYWKRPAGPGSTINGRDRHPVVQIAYEDAEAYATWAGKELPTEAEWEYAARGGLEGAVFSWGDEHFPDEKPMANTWQGEFPWQNLKLDGYEGTSPVGSFPPNGYGLYDMTGNVWEWTTDFFTMQHPDEVESPCCIPRNPRVASAATSSAPGETIPRRVIKGGSHLCAPNYCLRYRPAARQGEALDTSTGHIGFRCIVRTSADASEHLLRKRTTGARSSAIAMGASRIERVAIEVPAQRLEMGDVVLVHLPGEEATVEAKVVRDIERTPTTVRARVRAAERDDFVHEWDLGELVTVVRGP